MAVVADGASRQLLGITISPMTTLQTALEQAWQAHQAGEVAAAESVYRQVIARQPQHAAAHVYLGIALFDQRRFLESAAAYRAALAITPFTSLHIRADPSR